MKKEITIGQLLATAVTVLITVITAWVTLNNKVASLQTEMKASDKRQERFENAVGKIYDKLDNIIIKLENKKDR